MPDRPDQTEDEPPGRLEKAAEEQLGVSRWDRPQIFREAAEAAADNDLPYWLVLVLSGAIAALGLAMGSSAVVIGAMLVAPLLAPVVGLSLAMAVGDGRLALQVAAVVAASTLAVIATAALLTLILPFQSVTPEIASRTRPTTLDLAVAVFSGLVGAVVTVDRGSRLSAAIPGVAVAVALIPPLAVAGFGIGIGRTDIIFGSMLLYGANLAGIVLSGMAVFLLVGMHRQDVVKAARDWHRQARPNGLARSMCRLPWVRDLGVVGTPGRRGLLVLAFAVAFAIPLSVTLRQVAREVRVRRAVGEAEELFQVPGRTSVLGRALTFGDDASRAHIRVATAVWVDEERRQEFERVSSRRAGEPIRLVLEQLPATAGGVEDLAGILPDRDPGPSPGAQQPLPDLLERSQAILREALVDLPFPSTARPVGMTLVVPPGDEAQVDLAYVAPEPLEPQTREVLTGAVRSAVGHSRLRVGWVHLSSGGRPFDAGASAAADSLGALLRRYPTLRIELLAGEDADSAAVASAFQALSRAGRGVGGVAVRTVPGGAVRVRLRAVAGS